MCVLTVFLTKHYEEILCVCQCMSVTHKICLIIESFPKRVDILTRMLKALVGDGT